MQHHHTIHQRVERLFRHRLALGVVVGGMTIGLATVTLGKRDDIAVQRVSVESFQWLTSHMNHEHPTHTSAMLRVAKLPTISGGFEDA